MILNLYASMAIPLGLGFLSGSRTRNATKEWYPSLKKSKYTPPNWLFGPAWSILYLTMGYSSHLIRTYSLTSISPSIRDLSNIGLSLYWSQLVLNLLYTPLLFVYRRPLWSLVDLSFLWVNVTAMIAVFYKVDHKAGYLLMPYIAWLTYAWNLNYVIWDKNYRYKKLERSNNK